MPGPFTLGQIVSRLGGRVAGDPKVLIRQVGPLEHAAAGQISFFSDRKLKAKLAATRAGALIVAPKDESASTLPRIVVEQPYVYFARVSQLFNPMTTQAAGVDPSSSVAKTARLGERVSIGPGCVVGGCKTCGRKTYAKANG